MPASDRRRHVGLDLDFREDEIGIKATSRVEAAEPYDFWARLHFLAFFLTKPKTCLGLSQMLPCLKTIHHSLAFVLIEI